MVTQAITFTQGEDMKMNPPYPPGDVYTSRLCPKCLSNDRCKVQYIPAQAHFYRTIGMIQKPEALRWSCVACGWSFYTQTADAKHEAV